VEPVRAAFSLRRLLLAFPAIFPASATLIEKHEKQQKEKMVLTERSGEDRLRAWMPQALPWESWPCCVRRNHLAVLTGAFSRGRAWCCYRGLGGGFGICVATPETRGLQRDQGCGPLLCPHQVQGAPMLTKPASRRQRRSVPNVSDPVPAISANTILVAVL